MHVFWETVRYDGVRESDGGRVWTAVVGAGEAEESCEVGKGDGAECAGFVIWKLAMIRLSRFFPSTAVAQCLGGYGGYQ